MNPSTPDDTANWLGLRDRVFVVTGAASGIGRAIATAAAAAGASMVLLDRNLAGAEEVAAALRGNGARAVALACDTSSPESVASAAEETRRRAGPAEILVNNAGVLRSGKLESLTLADWNETLTVNLTGYFLCAQAFGRQMLEARRGRMVHIASIAGNEPQLRSGAYSASKAGVLMLSRQIAAEWGPSGICSNAVSPGLIRTPMSEAFYTAPGIAERRAAIVPSRRVGTPEDIAEAVLYLASDRAGYVNGAEIAVDGAFNSILMDQVPRPGF
jgi:NAD(P)-dependent dehydrogenase (short-subunit alcohol dehydrogenase family)